MSIENNNSHQSYNDNRARVFEIYGINPKDKRYNCHHIVTKNDNRMGIINLGYGMNCKENLYPIRNELHIILTSIINAVDNGKDTTYLMEKWHTIEANLDKRKTRQKSKRFNFVPVFIDRSVESNTLADRVSRSDLDKLLDFSNNYTTG